MANERIADVVREMAMDIGNYYLQKNNEDYVKTEADIRKLGITNIDIVETIKNGNTDKTVVEITTFRPGLLIGRKGENIDALTNHLGVHEIKCIEAKDDLLSYLIPTPPYDSCEDWDDGDYLTSDEQDYYDNLAKKQQERYEEDHRQYMNDPISKD